jgi:hypothetical protein
MRLTLPSLHNSALLAVGVVATFVNSNPGGPISALAQRSRTHAARVFYMSHPEKIAVRTSLASPS